MGFSQHKFLAMAPKVRAKKLSDLLRVAILRLGNDWKQAVSTYDQLVEWHCDSEQKSSQKLDFVLGNSTTHARALDLYQHWRTQAGLGAERDVYLQQDPGDLAEATSPTLAWSVLIHNLRSAYNVGSILRIVDCFGLQDAHLSGYTPSLDHAALRSAARGTETWIPCKRWDSPLDCIASFKEKQVPIYALETGVDAQNLYESKLPSSGLLVLGNEELGIAPELQALCDCKIFIPMHGRKASLNVAQAFAVLAAQLRNEYIP